MSGCTSWPRMCPNGSAGWPILSWLYFLLRLFLYNLWSIFNLALIHFNLALLFFCLVFLLLLLFFVDIFWVVFFKFPLGNTRIYYIFVRSFSGDVWGSFSGYNNIVIDNKPRLIRNGLIRVAFYLAIINSTLSSMKTGCLGSNWGSAWNWVSAWLRIGDWCFLVVFEPETGLIMLLVFVSCKHFLT